MVIIMGHLAVQVPITCVTGSKRRRAEQVSEIDDHFEEEDNSSFSVAHLLSCCFCLLLPYISTWMPEIDNLCKQNQHEFSYFCVFWKKVVGFGHSFFRNQRKMCLTLPLLKRMRTHFLSSKSSCKIIRWVMNCNVIKWKWKTILWKQILTRL